MIHKTCQALFFLCAEIYTQHASIESASRMINSIIKSLINLLLFRHHYENTPIQIHCKFYHQKMALFHIKNSDIFQISAQNIDCGYSLEPPHRGGSKEYPQSMFLSRNNKN